MGSNDRGHQKLHGVGEMNHCGKERPWDSLCEGWPGQEGIFRGCRKGMDGGNHGKPASTEMSLT